MGQLQMVRSARVEPELTFFEVENVVQMYDSEKKGLIGQLYLA
jgi:hypothetical protein